MKTWNGIKTLIIGNHDTEFKKRGYNWNDLMEVFEGRIHGLYKKYKTLVETYEDTEASMVNSTIEEHDSVIFN